MVSVFSLVPGCAHTPAPPPDQIRPTVSDVGLASYYTESVGRVTASGERFDHDSLTAAHRTLPFGTRVRVTHLSNQQSVVVTINDRGPVSRARLIDVSRAAARKLGMIAEGVARVRIEVLGSSNP